MLEIVLLEAQTLVLGTLCSTRSTCSRIPLGQTRTKRDRQIMPPARIISRCAFWNHCRQMSGCMRSHQRDQKPVQYQGRHTRMARAYCPDTAGCQNGLHLPYDAGRPIASGVFMTDTLHDTLFRRRIKVDWRRFARKPSHAAKRHHDHRPDFPPFIFQGF